MLRYGKFVFESIYVIEIYRYKYKVNNKWFKSYFQDRHTLDN